MPDANLRKRQILITAIESTYATDAAPQGTNSYQAIRLVDPFELEIGTELVEVMGGNLTRGMSRPIATVRPIGVTFRTYVVGLNAQSYTGNIKPPIGDLLRACGLFETFTSSNADGRPEYRYDTAADVGSDTSQTFVSHQDGYEHRFTGARGNVNLILKAAEPAVAEFNFRGMLTTEASTTRADSVVGLPTAVPPRWIGSGSIFIQSLSANMENMNFNTNNTVMEQRASRADSASGIINIWLTERAPGGSFDPQTTEPNTLDFFGVWRSTSGAVLRVQVGLTQGNRMTLIASQAVFKSVAWGNNAGLSLFSTNYQAYERNGNDEYRIIFD